VDVEGTRTFQAPADAYDSFMGRYSRELAKAFAALCLPNDGSRFLDVGCGPGALTAVAVDALGAGAVSAVDPTQGFVDACRARHPGLDVRRAAAESLPFDDDEFGSAAAQLVFHFVSDPVRGASEMHRVVRPGGVLAASVWDFGEGMEMLRAFWDAALALDSDAPDEARVMRFGTAGELTDLFTRCGLGNIEESTLTVSASYADFDELWHSFLAGIGPAGAYAVGLPSEGRAALRRGLFERLGRPDSGFRLGAVARVVRGVVAG
jgi:ubiquinone/menaquinone biosynthesis C-methylase UbiE